MSQNRTEKIGRIWDLATRFFHGALVVSVTAALVSGFEDKLAQVPGLSIDWGRVHSLAGITVLGLVMWRIIWGFVGSDTARFAHFVPGPRAVLAYMRGFFTQHGAGPAGHNPMGACMVVLLLLLLFAQAGMGLFADDDIFFTGPLRGLVSSSVSGNLTGWHKIIGEGLPWLVGLHITAALFYVLVKKRPIIAAIIHGKGPFTGPEPRMRPQFLALGLAAVVAGTLAALFLSL